MTLFFAAATQWRHAGLVGVPVGLDYAGVEAAARALGLAFDAATFGQIAEMEAEVVAVAVARERAQRSGA